MTLELLTGLALFAAVSSITPGPNNLMLMSSGANFGIRRTLPHLLGVALGFMVMVVLVGGGVSELFYRVNGSQLALQLASVLYLGYLALQMVRSSPPGSEGAARGRPLTFLQAALFQWVNPKSWAMALTAVTVYNPGASWLSVLFVAVIFGAINLPSVSLWALLGEHLRDWLVEPQSMRRFNSAMATLLLVSLLPLAGLV